MNDTPDAAALAALRPGDPVDKLATAVGARWRPPHAYEAGHIKYLEEDFGFSARLDRDGRIGEITYFFHFNPSALIEQVHVAMQEADVLRALPDAKFSDALPNSPYRFGYQELPGGGRMSIQIGHGRITRMSKTNNDAIYPDHGPVPLPAPATTFDVTIVPGLRPRGTPAPHGWCCGLPRGITPLQWPLSSQTGFPLEHHFTVAVPEPYRVKGHQYVALAFFSESGSESRSVPAIKNLLSIMFDGRDIPAQVTPDLQPFLDHLNNRHAMEFRSKDILYCDFAVIWLTAEEFTGAECEPPVMTQNSANTMATPPHWMRVSAAQRLLGWDGLMNSTRNTGGIFWRAASRMIHGSCCFYPCANAMMIPMRDANRSTGLTRRRVLTLMCRNTVRPGMRLVSP